MNRAHRAAQRIVVFTNKYPLLGPIVWMFSIQYFIVQLIVASVWPMVYDWKYNLISDLGNTMCGMYDGRYVCSPLYSVMNLSFVIFGITMALGAILIYTEFRRTDWTLIGFTLMSLAGFGTLLVGLFPENTVPIAHQVGATLGLFIGNVSILVLSYALTDVRRSFRIYTMLSALVSLIAFGLFVSGMYLGLGAGGMERVVSYPFTVWLILFGAYMTAVRIRSRRIDNTKTSA